MKIIGIILLILFAVIVIFFIKGKIHERRPWYDDNYFDDFKTEQLSRIITVFLMMWRKFGQEPQAQSMRICLFAPTGI